MPVHTFQSEGGQTIDVYVSVNASPTEHQLQIKDGVLYKRVYAAPLAAMDMGTRLGDASAHDFARITAAKRGFKVGDAWEVSQAMSEKRAQRDGVDFVKEQWYEKYQQENGEKHPDVKARETMARVNTKLADFGIEINLPRGLGA